MRAEGWGSRFTGFASSAWQFLLTIPLQDCGVSMVSLFLPGQSFYIF